MISLEQKIEALRTLHKGETMQKMAEEYGFSLALLVIGRGRGRISKVVFAKASNGDLKKRRRKECEYKKGSEALFLWFAQQREKGTSITGPFLEGEARIFRKGVNEGENDVTANIDWLDRWKEMSWCEINICVEISARSE